MTGPINLGNPVEFTIFELAEKIVALSGSRSEIAFRALPADDPMQRRPDISQAQSVLNWVPKVPLEKGLLNTIIYFEQMIRNSQLAYSA